MIPVTAARVAIALLSAAVAALGITVNALHWGGVDANLDFNAQAAAGVAIAVLAIISGTFAANRGLRVTFFGLTVLVASWAGGSTWTTRLIVAAVMIAIGVALPPAWRWVRSRSSPTNPSAVSTAMLVLFLGLSTGSTASSATGDVAQGLAPCDSAGLTVTSNGVPISLDRNEIDIELSGETMIFAFTAVSDRPARVGVWFDGFEPIDFGDDVLAWGGLVEPGRAGSYTVRVRRTGWIGSYELSFLDQSGAVDRDSITLVPGQTRLRAQFDFVDGEPAQSCLIEIDVRLLTEPHTTLVGLTGLALVTVAAVATSPSRRPDRVADRPADPLTTSVDQTVSPRPLLPDDLAIAAMTIGGATTSAPTSQIQAGSTEPFSITLRAKIDADDDEIERLKSSEIHTVTIGQAVRLITAKPSIDASAGGLDVTVSGTIRAGDEPGKGRISITIECGPEKTTVDRVIVVAAPDDELIDLTDSRSGASEAVAQTSTSEPGDG